MIAFIVPEITNDFYTTLSRGVEDVANANGFHIVIGNTDEDVAKERSYIELMVASAVEGVIIAPSSTSSKAFRLLSKRSVPTVLVDRTVKGFVSDTVRSNDEMGCALLAEHLIGLGHRRIALINGHPETSVAVEREAGYRRTLQENGIEYDPSLVSWGSWFIEDAERQPGEMLSGHVRFTAMIGANIFMTVGAIRALRRHDLSIPGDIALVSFNDFELAAEVYPFLTALSHPIYTMGRISMALFVERIRGNMRGETRDVVLSPSLIVRRSCGSHLPRTGATAVGTVPLI